MSSLFLLILCWAYWPGLEGPFLFDDYGNLNVLGAYGSLHNGRDLLLYLTSGNADPIGRPVALLSFLIDARNWPADPWPFKRTNVLLHLLNTGLLAVLLMRLRTAMLEAMATLEMSRWTPLAAAALWGAHPFFVSTTLYVIQREAMLPMIFALLGILAWMQAVNRFKDGHISSGWVWGVLGLGSATLLAGLSKANGLLTPALAGLVHLWFLRPTTTDRHATDRAAVICLGIPTLLLLLYLSWMGWSGWDVAQVPGRDWNIPERLLSEPRALWSYLWRLALPRAGGGGLFVDDFAVSRGWTEPATTLPAIVGLGVATMAAVHFRRRFPIASFAWLFFLTAHLMESSVVPLELYFEHRNYLAAAILGWPVAHVLIDGHAYLAYRRTAAAFLVCMLLLLTHERAIVWGDSQMLGELSAAHETDSIRAQIEAAAQDIEHDRTIAGLDRIHLAQAQHPGSVDIAVNAIAFECAAAGMVQASTLAYAQQALSTAARWNYGLNDWMARAAADQTLRGCRGFGAPGLKSLVASVESNPQNTTPLRKRDLWHVRGVIALSDGQPYAAKLWFDAALIIFPDPDYALVQAASLGEAGVPMLGVKHLYLYQQIRHPPTLAHIRNMGDLHVWLLEYLGYYRSELQSLRTQLQADADHHPLDSPRP